MDSFFSSSNPARGRGVLHDGVIYLWDMPIDTFIIIKPLPIPRAATKPVFVDPIDLDERAHIQPHLAKPTQHAIEAGVELAQSYQHAYVEPIHVCIGLLADDQVNHVLGDQKALLPSLEKKLKSRQIGKTLEMNDQLEDAILYAFIDACEAKSNYIEPIELFAALLKVDISLLAIFEKASGDAKQFAHDLEIARARALQK